MRRLRVLSLGGGIQSSLLLLMSCKGILPKLDAAVFADTEWEPDAVYENLAWLEDQASNAGIPVYRVTVGDLRADSLRNMEFGEGSARLPLFLRNQDGTRGKLNRQCTDKYKIVPITRKIRLDLLGLTKGQVAPMNSVEQWFGISADEMRRVRVSDDHWKTHVYPLCRIGDETLPRPMTRQGCLSWLGEHYPGRRFARSACKGCPFHRDAEWKRMRDEDPEAWADAVEYDKQIRMAAANAHHSGRVRLLVAPYLHDSLRPLGDVDLDDREQLVFSGFREECMGLCGN